MTARLLAAVVAATSVYAADPVPALQTASLGDLRLESGQVIHDCRITYRTFGKLNPAKSNAVLFPTWFTGRSDDLAPNIGAAGLVDPAQFFVIAVDALGDGLSSSPSNSTEQPRMRFPQFTIGDMVNSQHRLVTEVLGITHLRAVIGISMGGMQTFAWIVAYPDFMDKAVPVVGSPRLTSYDLLLWQSEADAIEEDAGWKDGNYNTPPPLRSVAEIHALALTTPAYRVREISRAAFPQFLKQVDASGLGKMDPNDWLRQLQAMMSQDVARPYGESMRDAAARVKAKVLVVAATQDHMVNPTPALEFADLLHAATIRMESDCGHLAPGCEQASVNPKVRAFLSE